MPAVDLAIGTIHYRSAGPEGAPRPILFIHGLLQNGEAWSAVADLLAARGIRSYAPDWPLGAHTVAMSPDADLSPTGIARSVLEFTDALDLEDVTLVGGVDGGAIVQYAIDLDPSPIGRVVLTNCPAFEQFPPAPINLLARVLANPSRAKLVLAPLRASRIRRSALGFGLLANRPINAALSRRWIEPMLTDADVRRDAARFLASVNTSGPAELTAIAKRLSSFDKPVRILWGTADPFFKPALAHRLADAFPDAAVTEIVGARTFVALDEPRQVADEIAHALYPTK
jgi:pimeloyl-ACP methyl ester carboxylesterase